MLETRTAVVASLGLVGFLGLIGASSLLNGCSAPGSDPPPGGPVHNGVTGGSSTTVDAGPLALPFTLSNTFVPSGFMGDSTPDMNAIVASNATSKCMPRQAGALGSCFTFAWTPKPIADAGTAWVGVYWQYPSNNWGAMPGRSIAPGATKVTFTAAGAAGGEDVVFIAGGVNRPSNGTPGIIYSDQFMAETEVTLTKSWATYEISLSGDSYSSVIGGFAWTITTSSTAPVTFYVDNIQWENTPDDAGE